MANKINVGKKVESTNNYKEFYDSVTKYVVQKDRDTPGLAVDYADDDIIELEYSDGTTWIGAAQDLQSISGVRGKKRGDEETLLPLELMGESMDRGIGSVVLSAFSVFSKKVKPVYKTLHAAIDALEDFVKEEGLFTIDDKFTLTKMTGTLPETTEPYLLFLHGTLSSTEGSFDKIVKNTEGNIWGQLVNKYRERIITLEHKTLAKGPLENVLDLVKHFPSNITLHLLTHSSGGILGDILCCCAEGKSYLSKMVNPERKSDVELVNEIEGVLKNKKIKVEKFIRVACPAAGTTLLSDKYVDYLNTMVNIIRVALPPYAMVAEKIKKIIVAIYSMKDNYEILPGLEAMVPGSDFQRMLNNRSFTISTPLTVIAGDGVASFSLKGLGTILFNLFYLHENDWMIDTESMDKGFKRSTRTYYLLSQHKQVNHFNYFNNKDTREAIFCALNGADSDIQKIFESKDALMEKDRGLIEKIFAGADLYPVKDDEISGTKPIIILLPGILGSNLYEVTAKDKNKLFVDDSTIINGGFVDKLDVNLKKNIEALSVATKGYGPFVEYFKKRYDVVIFPYDWRKPIKEASIKLAERIKQIQSRAKNQCINLVAHSMGGLVARHLLVVDKPLFESISNHSDFKLIFLGSPLRGAYIVPQILLGKGMTFKAFAVIDMKHKGKDLMRVFRDYQGLLNLLPRKNELHDFEDQHSKTWMELKSTDDSFQIPDTKWFKEFVQEAKAVEDALYSNPKVFYVAGTSDKTLCSYEIKNSFFKGRYVEFLSTNKGDGKVTWASGIPSQIKEGKRLFYVDTVHGDLGVDKDNFDGLAEILKQGHTLLLSSLEPMDRSGEEMITTFSDSEIFSLDSDALYEAIHGKRRKPKQVVSNIVNVSVKCGDLKYTRYPIMIGHFKNDAIVSAERVVNGYLDNRLSIKHDLKLYPENIGESDIFLNGKNEPAAIVVGLGSLENLTGSSLERTVTQGAINYILNCTNRNTIGKQLGLSVILIGSSYAGLSLDSSIKAIVNGVMNANTILINRGYDTKLITQLEIVELFEDKAIQTLKYLIQETESTKFNNGVRLSQKKVIKERGRRKRILSENREDWWSQLRIVEDLAHPTKSKDYINFLYTASGASSKSDSRNNMVNIKVVNSNLEQLAASQSWDMDKARLIFELLIPNDFKAAVRNQQHILLTVDSYSAQIPWELVHDTKSYSKPLATQVGIIRRIEMKDGDLNAVYVNENKALVVGDPILGNPDIQLPGAKIEAENVHELFTQQGIDSTPLINQDDVTIINALYSNQYKIIHLAGHGLYKANDELHSGMLIGEDSYLSNHNIRNLSYVPDLVFINCCHIGNFHADGRNKHELAASISLELIKKGVKCIIAAAWAIDDHAAKNFTEEFYRNMFNNRSFGESVLIAREDTYMKFGNKNTWAAYQCYGDQFYTLKDTNGVNKVVTYFDEEEAVVDIENLLLRMNVDKDDPNVLSGRIKDLENRIKQSNMEMKSLLNYLFGKAYAEIRDYDNAINYLNRAIAHTDGYLPSDAEQLLRKMHYKKYFNEWLNDKGKSYAMMSDVIIPIKKLILVNGNSERYNLLGSAFKALALFENDSKKKQKHLANSIKYYQKGLDSARDEQENTIYPLSNLIVLQDIVDIYNQRNHRHDYIHSLEKEYKMIEEKLDITNFWDMMALTNKLFVQTLLSVQSKRKGSTVNALKDCIARAWKEGGTVSNKLTELEHMDILLGFYKRIDEDKVADVKKELEFLEDFKLFITRLNSADKRNVFD